MTTIMMFMEWRRISGAKNQNNETQEIIYNFLQPLTMTQMEFILDIMIGDYYEKKDIKN